MKNFLIFLAFCTLAAAMVPRDRKSEDVTKAICAPRTPCRWDVLKTNTYIVESHINNDFCECPVDTTCERSEMDENAYIYKCKRPQSTTVDEDEH